jgi:hypothetical protein
VSALLQVMLVKVGSNVPDDLAAKIIDLLISVFQSQHRVTENGLIAFSGLCNGLGDRI